MHSRNSVLPALAAALLLGACTDAAPEPTAPVADLSVYARRASVNAMGKDRYIVVFRDDTRNVPALADRMVAEHGGTMHFRYEHALKGFAATLSPQAVEALRRNPNVKYVEADVIVEAATIQEGAPWGLDRMDQLDLPLSGYYNYGNTGAGVNAYVIDSGIQASHPQFGGRARVGADFVGDGRNGEDCDGHGTHVAGILGATTYGVAKQVNLIAVRVLNCLGGSRSSMTIAGINWVIANHVPPAVANMSLISPGHAGTDEATRNLIASGVTVVAGAGQTTIAGYANAADSDACLSSPARVAEALTVSASDAQDRRVVNRYTGTLTWTASNGPCVDLFAPGDDIPSTWLNGGTLTMGGTSMATPHVAGYVARYLQSSPAASPATIASYILAWGNPIITSAGPGTTNKLLHTGGRRRATGS
jgi:subtilisin family serine protease